MINRIGEPASARSEVMFRATYTYESIKPRVVELGNDRGFVTGEGEGGGYGGQKLSIVEIMEI